MLTKEAILKIDKSKVYSIYEEWPNFAINALKNDDYMEREKPSMLVFVGMGGSGAIGDIASDLLCNDIPTYVIKGYNLPRFIDSRALIIATSVSGNTKETIAICKEAYQRDIELIGVSAGGALEELCNKYNYKHIKIEQHLMPRYSLPDALFTVLNILSKIKSFQWIKEKAYNTINVMKEVHNIISIDNESDKNIAKQLALYINNNTPVIYTSPSYKSVGIRFRSLLNENSKVLAINSDIVEASHNEIASWINAKGFKPIMIRNPADIMEVNDRFAIFRDILKEYKHDVYELPLFSNDMFANMIASIYVLDYATLYLAVLKGVDPLPIEPITKLKDMMEKCK